MLNNIIVRPGYCVIEPIENAGSEFSSEKKFYDRHSIGKIIAGNFSDEFFCDDLLIASSSINSVVYDDSNAIQMPMDGKIYDVVKSDALLVVLPEDK